MPKPIKLKTRRLGLAMGPSGEIYIADSSRKSSRVLVFDRPTFMQAVRERRVQAGQWCVAVPRNDVLLKTITLPTSDEDEARQMLEFELPSFVPVQNGDMCHDLLAMTPREQGMTDWLVVMSPRSRVEKAGEALLESGITAGEAILDSVAIWRAVGHGRENFSGVLMVADSAACQSLTIDKGTLRSARMLPDVLGKPLDAGVLLSEAGQEPDRGELVPDAEGGGPQVLIVGAREVIDALGAQPAGPGSLSRSRNGSYETLSCPAQIHVCESQAAQVHICEAAVLSALGCAQERATGIQLTSFSLAPHDWMKRHHRRRQMLAWARTVSLALAVPMLAFLLLKAKIMGLEEQRIFLEREIAPIEEVATALESKKLQARLIQNQLSRRDLPLRVLAELYRCIPEQISLSYLSVDLDPADPQIRMKGPAGSLETAFAFPLILDKSPMFTDVRPEGAQQVSRGEGVLIEFGCRCKIAVDGNPGRPR